MCGQRDLCPTVRSSIRLPFVSSCISRSFLHTRKRQLFHFIVAEDVRPGLEGCEKEQGIRTSSQGSGFGVSVTSRVWDGHV